jgi:hypothetical protein
LHEARTGDAAKIRKVWEQTKKNRGKYDSEKKNPQTDRHFQF